MLELTYYARAGEESFSMDDKEMINSKKKFKNFYSKFMEESYTKVIPRRKQNVASNDSQNQIIRRKSAKKLCIAC